VTLEFDVSRRLGAFTIEASFTAGRGVTSLFGRSGAGKTSIVNMIAGLLKPDRGRIAVDGRVLFDSETRVDVPAARRRVGCVFQDDRLFPHLTVRQNLHYGRWFTRSRDRYADFDQIVALLGIGRLLDRRPAALSGGERQRVAIGRALLASPRILLMDEPLASLDEPRKTEILPYIERLRDELRIPIVYVSHAVAEVTRLATTLVLLSDGHIEAAGPVEALMGRMDLFPLTGRFEAGAVLACTVARHEPELGLTRLASKAGELRVPLTDLEPGTELRVRVRSRDVMLAVERPVGLSALNALPARIAEIRIDSPFADVRLDAGGETILARITEFSVGNLELAPGREVYALIKSIAFDHRSLGLPRLE
jgi:molybdate transport system ATP-binding protein